MSRRDNRPSPSVSATLYDAGDRMRGNDGNMYQIVQSYKGTNRWSKLAKDSQYDAGGQILHKVREPDKVVEMLEDTGLYQDFMNADNDGLRYNIFQNAEEIIEKGVYKEGGKTKYEGAEITGYYNEYGSAYQDEVEDAVRDLTADKYEALCYAYNVDPNNANEMSDFIANLNQEEAEDIMNYIRTTEGKSYKKGGRIEFRKLAKSKNFDIIVEEGRFEIELDKDGSGKYILDSKGNRKDINNNPIALKYQKQIQKHIGDIFFDRDDIEYAKGGELKSIMSKKDIGVVIPKTYQIGDKEFGNTYKVERVNTKKYSDNDKNRHYNFRIWEYDKSLDLFDEIKNPSGKLKALERIEMSKDYAKGGEVNLERGFTQNFPSGEYQLIRELKPTKVVPEGQYEIKNKKGKKIILAKSRFTNFAKGGSVQESKLYKEYIAKGGDVFYSRFSKEFFEKDGLGAKYVSNNKFDDKRYKKDMIDRLQNANRPVSVIEIWGRNTDMDVSKYIDGVFIEDEQFAIDNTKQAKKLYTSKYSQGGEVKKKGNNEIIIGGLAGIILGVFLNK